MVNELNKFNFLFVLYAAIFCGLEAFSLAPKKDMELIDRNVVSGDLTVHIRRIHMRPSVSIVNMVKEIGNRFKKTDLNKTKIFFEKHNKDGTREKITEINGIISVQLLTLVKDDIFTLYIEGPYDCEVLEKIKAIFIEFFYANDSRYPDGFGINSGEIYPFVLKLQILQTKVGFDSGICGVFTEPLQAA